MSALRYLKKAKILYSLVFLLISLAAFGQTGPAVDNFVLLDQYGEAHELHYLSDKKAVVVLAYSSEIKGSLEQALDLLKLQQSFDDSGINYYFLDSNPSDNRAVLLQQKLPLDIPVLIDEAQLIAGRLGLTHIGEAILINPQGWRTIYRGPISEAGKPTLENALTNLLKGDDAFSSITMPTEAAKISVLSLTNTPSYSDDIAPLLQEKCVSCHREGGIGPWAMSSYQMIQGFAPMIREVVLTKRMPPWHADPHINKFNDDISLSLEQQKQLVSWINDGAPRGEGDDPLLSIEPAGDQWVLGEPDLIIDLPEFQVPATGSVDYQFFETVNPLDRDVWIKAIHIIPGARASLHHAISTFGEPDDPSRPIKPAEGGNEGSALLQQQLMTFVPGNEHYIYPEDTALLLTKGSSLFTQMHYTTSGKAAADKTRIGLYFRDEPPEHVLRHFAIANPWIRIPPMESAHAETAYFQPDRDIVVYSLFPHAHYRGRSSKFSIRYPDGREELLLSVPNYDFNWQRYFQLETPLDVPAGSMLIHTTVFDNSPQGKANPDPSATVLFGLQSWEEMLYGGISYREKEGGLENTGIEEAQFQADLFIGALDTDQDNKLEVAELPEPMQKRMGGLFPWVDGNQNNGLENDELKKLFEMMAERRRSQQQTQ